MEAEISTDSWKTGLKRAYGPEPDEQLKDASRAGDTGILHVRDETRSCTNLHELGTESR